MFLSDIHSHQGHRYRAWRHNSAARYWMWAVEAAGYDTNPDFWRRTKLTLAAREQDLLPGVAGRPAEELNNGDSSADESENWEPNDDTELTANWDALAGERMIAIARDRILQRRRKEQEEATTRAQNCKLNRAIG